jgi:hypothetical protein
MIYCDSRCSQTLTGLSLALPGARLWNATRRLRDRQRVILRQRIRGSVRAVRAVRNTRVFQTETRVVADESDAQCQRWKQSLKSFIYHWNVGTWTVRNSLRWINPGDILIPPTMNLGGLHCMCSRGIHKHCLNDSDTLHTCHNHRRNAWNGCPCVVFCSDNEAYHIIKMGLISP